MLLDACVTGDLDDVVHLVQLGADVHVRNDKPFRKACEAGHLHVAQWLYGSGQFVDIYARHCKCFWRACARGHLAVAQWLASLGELDFDDLVAQHGLHLAFWYASAYGHLHVLQWLFSLARPALPQTLHASFEVSCQCAQVDVAKWLWAVAADAVRVHVCVHNHWRTLSVSTKHRPLARWLLEIESVHAAWPAEGLRALQAWSACRDVWMRSVAVLGRPHQS